MRYSAIVFAPIGIAAFFVAEIVLADAELFEVTKENLPTFIDIRPRQLSRGATRFDIVMRNDASLTPGTASITIGDGERLRFQAYLMVLNYGKENEWETFVSLDNELLKSVVCI